MARTDGVWEPGLSAALCERLGPNSTFYDVGAGFGYFVGLAIAAGVDRGDIHAFEPDQDRYYVLNQNFADRGVQLSRSFVGRGDAVKQSYGSDGI